MVKVLSARTCCDYDETTCRQQSNPKNPEKEILNMRHNKFLSAAIVLFTIAFFTVSAKPVSPHKPGPVSIKIVGFPAGTVTATGAL